MEYNASFPSLLLLTLKEIRLENRVHPGRIAEAIGITPGEWTKIEDGESSLTIGVLRGACRALAVAPSFVMALAERLTQQLEGHGWYFQDSQLGKHDDLLPLIKKYYNSAGFQSLRNRPSEKILILALNTSGFWPEPTIVSYCCNQDFRAWVDKGAPPGGMPQITVPTLSSLVTTATAGNIR